MVRSGEQAGNLDEVMGRLAEFMESSQRLRSKVASAMMYPVIMIVVAGGLMTILMVAVVPQITRMFVQQGKTLPPNTRLLIWTSHMAGAFWYVWLGLLIVGAVGFRSWSRSPAGRPAWHRMKLKVPLFGPLLRQVAVARFTRTLGTMLEAGVPMLRSLETAKEVLGNAILMKAVDDARAGVTEGESLAAMLRKSGQFPHDRDADDHGRRALGLARGHAHPHRRRLRAGDRPPAHAAHRPARADHAGGHGRRGRVRRVLDPSAAHGHEQHQVSVENNVPETERPTMKNETTMKGAARAALSGQQGMTLLEIMIVLAIITLVMAVLVGPRVMEAFSSSKVKVAKITVNDYANNAYPQWSTTHSGCPQALGDLKKYMNKQDTKDPWGNEFIMLCGDKAPEAAHKFGVVSKGPDEKLDTPDDIKSWEQPKDD